MVDGDGKTSSSGEMEKKCIRVLCRRRITAAASSAGRSVFWLVGSPRSFPPFTVISVVKCLHWDPSVGLDSINFSREADDLRAFLLRGLDVVGALFIDDKGEEESAIKAVDISARMRHLLFDDKDSYDMIGAVSDVLTKDISFFVKDGKSRTLEAITSIVYENQPEKYVGERVCLLKCAPAFMLPIYIPLDKTSDALEMVSSMIDATAAKFRHPKTCYIVEAMSMSIPEKVLPVILHGADLDLSVGSSTSKCSDLSKSKPSFSKENADIIQVSLYSNQSEPIDTSSAPLAEYFPAPITARYYLVNVKLDVLCYAAKDFTLTSSISELVIPGLVDQLFILKKAITPNLFTQQPPQLFPYHFFPPGCLHPITTIYDLTYGEMEMKQVETRRCLHQRLGLPLDRPLLLTANALTFDPVRDSGRDLERGGSMMLKDVHSEISSSSVSGGLVSLVEGSYGYYHYLQDGFDDSGWGCAYRSLQTIISWFKLQNYTSIEVPSHREIQKALVEIGDKEPAFIGSREWIGAIELSFVLDKLLGVNCKIINVRSGSELPEKCRELALHFETQGTPIMIGGGVLAYTLLGVDYNDVSGDSAFLILDPHYTGSDEVRRIVSGGWCGWKKAIDSKGKSFFLSDKFYNLLLPQRPKMV